MQQTKYCNNVIMMSVLERRKSTNKNSWNRYCLDMKHITVNNMNVPLCSWPLVMQGSEATDLRGSGSFKYTFLSRFFLNLNEKKLQKLVHVCQHFATWRYGCGSYCLPCILLWIRKKTVTDKPEEADMTAAYDTLPGTSYCYAHPTYQHSLL